MTTSFERPRGIFEIFSESFDIYGKAFTNFWIPFLIIGVITGAISAFFNIFTFHFIEDLSTSPTIDLGALILSLFLTILLLIGFTLISNSVATGMVVSMVKPVATNQPIPSLSEAFGRAQRVLLQLILGSFLFILIVIVGFILLIIPGLIFITWFYIFSVCIVLEDESTTGSFSRSKDLVSGYGFHTFGLILVSFFGIFILSAVLGIISNIIIPYNTIYNGFNAGSYILGTIITSAIGSIVTPIGGIMSTLLYFDLKARKEQLPMRTPYTYPQTSTSYPAATFCKNCGAALPTDPNSIYCAECGTKVR